MILLIQRLNRVYVFIEIFLVVFWLELFAQIEFEILVDVHMYFIDEPRNEFVGVVVLIVIEKGIPCTNSCDESAMVYHASVPFGLIDVFEEFI